MAKCSVVTSVCILFYAQENIPILNQKGKQKLYHLPPCNLELIVVHPFYTKKDGGTFRPKVFSTSNSYQFLDYAGRDYVDLSLH